MKSIFGSSSDDMEMRLAFASLLGSALNETMLNPRMIGLPRMSVLNHVISTFSGKALAAGYETPFLSLQGKAPKLLDLLKEQFDAPLIERYINKERKCLR